MYAMFDYVPKNASDTRLTSVTASTSADGFPATNLQDIKPAKIWKSTVITATTIVYYFGVAAVSYRNVFLNRFNFAAFKLYTSTDNVNWTERADVSGLLKDEIEDENYMHYWVDMGAGLSYNYLKLTISAQTPAFEPTYFKLGNMLVFTATEIWNPKAGFNVKIIPNESIQKFPSGATNVYKLGRISRIISGEWDKISITEYNKIIKTRNIIVIYQDFESDANKCYLVRLSPDMQRNYQMATLVSVPFSFDEVV